MIFVCNNKKKVFVQEGGKKQLFSVAFLDIILDLGLLRNNAWLLRLTLTIRCSPELSVGYVT